MANPASVHYLADENEDFLLTPPSSQELVKKVGTTIPQGIKDSTDPAGSKERRKSSPKPIASPQPSSPTSSQASKPTKPRQLPTITPRKFKRFFTPRSSLDSGAKCGSSRKVLRDITAGGLNCQGPGQRRRALKDTRGIPEDATDIVATNSRKRKARPMVTPNTTPENSSPLKRFRVGSSNIYHDEESNCDTDTDGGVPIGKADMRPVKSIIRWQQHGNAGHGLIRETGGTRPGGVHSIDGPEWQHETTRFFSGPEDLHACVNVAQTGASSAIPFCAVGCHSNPLVAIGDEEGAIRLLDSEKGANPRFSKAFLSFRPHTNAVLDLCFSPDDLLLATASGDQSSRVIDMPTQQPIFGMAAHTSSVKQVRFQSGHCKVIATSSRDGSVLIWDLRCRGYDGPVQDLRARLSSTENDGSSDRHGGFRMRMARPTDAIHKGHIDTAGQNSRGGLRHSKSTVSPDAPYATENQNRRGDISITCLSFLQHGREHLLLTGSEADATVKLWDLRQRHSNRRGRCSPVSSTKAPESHGSHRAFGLTSMALSGDGGRLYTACRDNTIYTYSTPHLMLGHAPELSTPSSRPNRVANSDKEGLGPIYGFRHPKFHAATFFVKCALRPAVQDNSELLAAGSSDGCAVVFPTNEKYLSREVFNENPPLPRSRSTLFRTDSNSSLFTRLNDTIPIYQKGTALIRGHSREVTGVNWTSQGELITVGDDLTARCWREGSHARDLRLGGETEGRRWRCGWAEAEPNWDDDE